MDYSGLYAHYLENFLKLENSVRCVADSSNGTTGSVLKKIKGKKFNIKLINGKADGKFPSHGPDPWKKGAMDGLKKNVRAAKADFGVIFDADGDRVFFVDDLGDVVSPEAVALLLAKDFPPPYLVDLRMGWLIKKSKLRVVESRVGHYFIKKLMAKKQIKLGVEFSGHIYFENRIRGKSSYFDSGLRAMMHFANAVSALKARNLTISSWLKTLDNYSRCPETNFVVRDKEAAIKKLERFYGRRSFRVSHLDGLTAEFKNWWFNVRPSNTESLLRLNIEAANQKILNTELKRIARLIK